MSRDFTPREARGPRIRVEAVPQSVDGPSVTQQQFADEVDINRIMKRFERGEALTHFNQYQGQYADVSGIDFQLAMNQVTATQQLFDALPVHLRSRFRNRPEEFLAFVQDPQNAQEAYELGIGPAPDRGPGNPPPGQTGGRVAADTSVASVSEANGQPSAASEGSAPAPE